MANTNPGGVEVNTSPYFDDYDEDKKFVRVLYVPGRAVQARELSQSQTLQQVQVKRFAEYFFKQGALVTGCEQNLDLNVDYLKLQSTFNGSEVNVDSFEGKIVYGSNSGITAYCGIVSDIDGADPKTLFINYQTSGGVVLTVNNAATILTPGNTITFDSGNTAVIKTTFIHPITGQNRILVANVNGTLATGGATTVANTGASVPLNVTAILDNRSLNAFQENEVVFTSDVTGRSYANTATVRATSTIVDEGLATETTYTKGSKITVNEGIVYLADHFIKNSSQTIILDKYTNVPSYKVGLVPQKSFVDYIEDQSLLDNAQGTPNFQAPGADRLKIDTVLTKVAAGATVTDQDFITLLDIEDGIAKKRKNTEVESKLEDALAQRTSEESGDYTINDPVVTVREHLNQSSNGGRYSLADGGNNNLLLFEVEPFTAYVDGYRSEFIAKNYVEVQKGLTTEYVEQTKTQINFGQYIDVNELTGSWDFTEATKVDLYDTPQQVITNGTYSAASVTGNKIGEARVRAIEYVSGVQGTATAAYHLYLYEITMNAGEVFSDVRAIYDSATPKRFADVIIATGTAGATLNETSFNSLIFRLPYGAIKTIRDTQENVESGFRFKKKFSVTFNAGAATVSTSDSSETFVGTDILSAAQKNEFYQIIVNNSGVDVETAALTGTVSVSAGTKIVTGSSTVFASAVNIGDVLKINGQEVKVASISNNTYLTLESNHTSGASANTFTKILPTGYVIPMDKVGGLASSRSVNVTSPGAVIINIQENATFTAEIVATMDRANAREKRKTLNYQTQVQIQANTHPNGLAGPFSLGYGDLYQVHGIYQSSGFGVAATTSNTNVTANYTVNNGQTDYSYEHATITPKPGVVPTGRLLVVFDHFTHDTSQGLGYASVDSYPIDDAATSNTTINTVNIPTFTSPVTGRFFDLRNCVDFRPIKTAATGLNPADPGTYQIPFGGLHIPKPYSDFDSDLIFYKGRIATVYVNSKGQFGVNNGVPATGGNQLPFSPPKLPDTLELAEVIIPPYPSRPKDVRIKLKKNKRFTMSDISKINDRVEKLEYFTTLSFLEKQASEKTEIDEVGLDRFKNGILVDAFTGYSVSAVSNPDWSASIDRQNRFVTAKQDNANNTAFRYNSAISTTELQDGNKVMLPFTEVSVSSLTQPYASRQLRLAEELNFIWAGDLAAYPFVDNWVETTNDPDKAIVYDDTGEADNWAALIDAWNSEVAPLNTFLTGPTDTSLVSGTQQQNWQGNFIVTTQVQRTTQALAQQLATIQQGATQTVASDRVVDVVATLFMRSRDFIIHATGMKSESRVYAFFDGTNVTSSCDQIRLTGTKTINEIVNENFDNDGILTGENTDWIRIKDGATEAMRIENSEIYVLFRVPANTFYVGQREFRLTDSPTNSDGTTLTLARNTIFAQALTQVKSAITINSRPFDVSFNNENAIQVVGRRTIGETRIETGRVFVPPPPPPPVWWGWDPLSQSFFVDSETYPSGFYVTSIDLYFRTKSRDNNRNVTVEIREMVNGYPGAKVIGIGDRAVVNNSNINVSEDATAATTFTFKNPIYLGPGNEYAFCIKPEANDPDFAVWVAELGEIDISDAERGTRIEAAYGTGVLFTSSNDRTWTARQNLDVKFTMRIAQFNTDEKIAYWSNISVNNAYTYDVLQAMISDQVLSDTNIQYQIKTIDENNVVDGDWTDIKNYERLILPARRKIANATTETTNNIKSLQFRAILSTDNQYVTPYIDNENIRFGFSKNIINNEVATDIDGTVTFNSGSNIVVGSGTDFSNTVFAGEYAYFGDEYRRIQQISNNTYLTVATNFTTSGAGVDMQIRREENPSGPYSSESRYITRTVELNDGFEATDMTLYLNINRPPGTGIKVYCKLLNENDTDSFDDKFYTEMSLVGAETFTSDRNLFREEKYVVPSVAKTGGSELLAGTVAVSTSTSVTGTNTRFTEDLRIGDTIAVGTARTERVVATIANNTFLTVESGFGGVASSQDIFKVLNNEVAYTTPDGRTFNGYKYFAIKVVFTSSNANIAPRVKDLRAIALA
jgi:hypothetical protein